MGKGGIMDIKKELLEIINKPKYEPLTLLELCSALNLSSDYIDEVRNALIELENDSLVFLNKKRTRYLNINQMGLHLGKFLAKSPNYGFINSQDYHYDLYVAKSNQLDAMDKDEVLFKVNKDYVRSAKSHDEATIVKVTKRNIETLVGKVYQKKNSFYLENDYYNLKINNLSGAKIDDIVNVKITKYNQNLFEGDVISIIGSNKMIGIDILMEAVRHGFDTKFSDSAMYEAKTIERNLEEEKKRRRLSFDKDIYTIDGDDSKDLDDAISIKRLDNGNYFLGVYIADVSFYVTKGSALDLDAYRRATSLYLVDYVIPMLPERLSNDLCSLNPSEEKLAIACEMEVDSKGNVITSDVFETVIKTKKRLTYSKCNELLENGKCSDESYNSLYDVMVLFLELSNILGEKFHKRGSLDFDIPEAKILVDNKGRVIDVVKRERGKSEKIIENFMILTNETIASMIEAMDLPFIYRVHDKPDIVKLYDLRAIAGYMGYSLRADYASEVQKFLESIAEGDEFLKTLTLRMMPKAIYSEENIGHFGLASASYTHFTSPIRRYPDLLVHRLLRKYIFNGQVDANEFDALTQEIANIAIHASKKERDSIQCEYDVNDKKMCEYMEGFIGSEFIGKISSITNFGMFVTLDNTIEGLVRIKDMTDDYYIFDEHLYMLKGERTNRKYRIGDSVKIRVSEINKQLNEIEFSLVYNKSGKKHGKESHRKK